MSTPIAFIAAHESPPSDVAAFTPANDHALSCARRYRIGQPVLDMFGHFAPRNRQAWQMLRNKKAYPELVCVRLPEVLPEPPPPPIPPPADPNRPQAMRVGA